MRALFPLLVAGALAGCPLVRSTAPVAAPASICFQPDDPVTNAKTGDTGVRWSCNAATSECWDQLGEKVAPALASKALSEARGRLACTDFINDLYRRKVIQRGK